VKALRIVIVGGGAVGLSTALFTKRLQPEATVTVVERDPTYARASSALSASSIRMQFSTPLNIALSMFGLQFLRQLQASQSLQLVEGGYLFVATPAGEAVLRANHAVQTQHGAAVRLLSPAQLKQLLAWVNTSDLSLATLGHGTATSGEGWFDGYALTQALRRMALAEGVQWLKDEVVALEHSSSAIHAARTASGERLAADYLVNAAGPWARHVAAMAGVALPVFARRRTVFVMSCPTPIHHCPLVVDPSGVWFRPEGGDVGRQTHFIGGTSPKDGEPDPDDLPLEPDLAQFEQAVWPAMAHRVPAFEALRVESAWAGYYEVHPMDHNGIVGPHPALKNLLFANGFSGHGIQHSPGVGRAVAEWLASAAQGEGRYQSIDLTPLGFERVLSGTPFVERNVV
jgi:glycine/D-amino acid oxidase-like deaminating enzyme